MNIRLGSQETSSGVQVVDLGVNLATGSSLPEVQLTTAVVQRPFYRADETWPLVLTASGFRSKPGRYESILGLTSKDRFSLLSSREDNLQFFSDDLSEWFSVGSGEAAVDAQGPHSGSWTEGSMLLAGTTETYPADMMAALRATINKIRAGKSLERSEELRALARRAVSTEPVSETIDEWARRLSRQVADLND